MASLPPFCPPRTWCFDPISPHPRTKNSSSCVQFFLFSVWCKLTARPWSWPLATCFSTSNYYYVSNLLLTINGGYWWWWSLWCRGELILLLLVKIIWFVIKEIGVCIRWVDILAPLWRLIISVYTGNFCYMLGLGWVIVPGKRLDSDHGVGTPPPARHHCCSVLFVLVLKKFLYLGGEFRFNLRCSLN